MGHSVGLFLTFFMSFLPFNTWAAGTTTKATVDFSKYGLTLPADIIKELSTNQANNNCSIFYSSTTTDATPELSSSPTTIKEICVEYFANQLRTARCAMKTNKTEISSSEALDMAYEYGTAAILVISIIPFFLFLAVPSEKKWYFSYVMTFLIALAASTLISDAVLHLIPQTLIPVENRLAPNKNEIVYVSDIVVKQVMVLVAIYGMYLFEMLMGIRERLNEDKKEMEEHPIEYEQNHSHDHANGTRHRRVSVHMPQLAVKKANLSMTSRCRSVPSNLSGLDKKRNSMAIPEECEVPSDGDEVLSHGGIDIEIGDGDLKNCKIISADIGSIAEESIETKTETLNEDENNGKCTKLARRIFKGRLLPKKSFGWIILLSDLTHNVMDGIAIGAAFSKSPINGLSTSVAVAFHEIPHEIGDFAALMHSGVSKRAAMFWSLLFSLLSLVAFYIGVEITNDERARSWVLAFTTGIFLHHSIGEFFPALQDIEGKFWPNFALQNIGILLGFLIMFLLSIFEQAFHFD